MDPVQHDAGRDYPFYCFLLPVDVDPACHLLSLLGMDHIEISSVRKLLARIRLPVPLVNIVRKFINFGTVAVEDRNLHHIEGTKVETVVVSVVVRGDTFLDLTANIVYGYRLSDLASIFCCNGYFIRSIISKNNNTWFISSPNIWTTPLISRR